MEKVEIKLSTPYDPTENTALITAWVGNEQVGSLTIGKPSKAIDKFGDWMLGQLFVIEKYRRNGIATEILDFALQTFQGSFFCYVTSDGQKLLRNYNNPRITYFKY